MQAIILTVLNPSCIRAIQEQVGSAWKTRQARITSLEYETLIF